MSAREIAEWLAGHGVVESMVRNITGRPLDTELMDLVQMVYQIVLEYDGDVIESLWESRQLRFFLARIIMNQYRSRTSPFYRELVRFREMSLPLREDIADGGDY